MSQIDKSLFKDEPQTGGGSPFGAYAQAPPSGVGFKDPRGLTTAVSVMIVLSMLANAAFVLTAILMPADPIVLGGIALAVMCITFPQFVMLMIWFYRANKNARAISNGLETTPGWAVGFFFVPVLSWFRPYLTMSEIWRSAQSPLSWKSLDDPIILRIWWGCWLAGAIGGMVANFGSDGGLGPLIWIATAFAIAADGITLHLIRIVAARQWENKDQSVFD